MELGKPLTDETPTSLEATVAGEDGARISGPVFARPDGTLVIRRPHSPGDVPPAILSSYPGATRA